tara:strand:- start:613 stop:741 length:129 start_codon:yes stop_codon:yes gene_type:complete
LRQRDLALGLIGGIAVWFPLPGDNHVVDGVAKDVDTMIEAGS